MEIDLSTIDKRITITRWVEDHFTKPAQVEITSIHPKSIEITTEEFLTKEVEVALKVKGRLAKPLVRKNTIILPDKVTITGYKSKIEKIQKIYVDETINLSNLKASFSRRMDLDKKKEILKIEEGETVNVTIEIEDPQKKSTPEKEKVEKN